jgi:Flp pilus assembly protein TadB
MSNPASPSGTDMRIGDAERTEVADRLARHFSHGRLDDAEFSQRLDRAMRAKTRADLSGLLADLPPDPAPAPQGGRAEKRPDRRAGRQRRRQSVRTLVLLVGLVIGALMIARWLAHSTAVWIILAVIAFAWLRRDAARSRPSPQPGADDLGRH